MKPNIHLFTNVQFWHTGRPFVANNHVVHCAMSMLATTYCCVMYTSLDLNAAESGVQHKPAVQRNPINNDQAPNREGCSC